MYIQYHIKFILNYFGQREEKGISFDHICKAGHWNKIKPLKVVTVKSKTIIYYTREKNRKHD